MKSCETCTRFSSLNFDDMCLCPHFSKAVEKIILPRGTNPRKNGANCNNYIISYRAVKRYSRKMDCMELIDFKDIKSGDIFTLTDKSQGNIHTFTDESRGRDHNFEDGSTDYLAIGDARFLPNDHDIDNWVINCRPVDDVIEEWHTDSSITIPLHTHMGMEWDDYKFWLSFTINGGKYVKNQHILMLG